jgi:hypothetical protein
MERKEEPRYGSRDRGYEKNRRPAIHPIRREQSVENDEAGNNPIRLKATCALINVSTRHHNAAFLHLSMTRGIRVAA